MTELTDYDVDIIAVTTDRRWAQIHSVLTMTGLGHHTVTRESEGVRYVSLRSHFEGERTQYVINALTEVWDLLVWSTGRSGIEPNLYVLSEAYKGYHAGAAIGLLITNVMNDGR